jgi:hypothetical protein
MGGDQMGKFRAEAITTSFGINFNLDHQPTPPSPTATLAHIRVKS